MDKLDELCINTLRFLAVDAVEAARSGHPGLPLGAAPIGYVLWHRHLCVDPTEPGWFNRDRFILSAGHGSALLYALIHAFGYDLPLGEIERFRQWDSMTPGHPEYGLTPGVEATTGPLGQGLAMGVGMAIAERYLAQQYNREGFPVIDHYTYAIVSDGDLMEGVSHEAASLAGTLRLSKLIYLYDDNAISIEGSTGIAFTEDVGARFEAYGWHVEHVADANDIDAIDGAVHKAQAQAGKPSLIIVKSHIGYGSPKQDDASVHGEPLGPEAAAATKRNLGWPPEPAFHIPEDAREHFKSAADRGKEARAEWQTLVSAYRAEHPDLAGGLEGAIHGDLPEGWQETIPTFSPDNGPIATRNASGTVMNAVAAVIPGLIGGSADLAPSTKTLLNDYEDFLPGNSRGRNLRFGVREFVMGAVVNGMAVHGGLVPYGSTFLVFSDYMRPALRLAGMMKAPGIFVFSHDSIALGEDGPTHQPVEQLMSLRTIPNMTVLRPADANETALCWKVAIERRAPTALALTRQKLPVLDPAEHPLEAGVPRGAYTIKDVQGKPDVILLATGSEVHLALEAAKALADKEIRARVVSMPSWEIFEEQPVEYRQQVLPPDIPRLAVEAGVTLGWHKYTGTKGDVIGLDRFGASAPGAVAYRNLGFSVENVVARATNLVGG